MHIYPFYMTHSHTVISVQYSEQTMLEYGISPLGWKHTIRSYRALFISTHSNTRLTFTESLTNKLVTRPYFHLRAILSLITIFFFVIFSISFSLAVDDHNNGITPQTTHVSLFRTQTVAMTSLTLAINTAMFAFMPGKRFKYLSFILSISSLPLFLPTMIILGVCLDRIIPDSTDVPVITLIVLVSCAEVGFFIGSIIEVTEDWTLYPFFAGNVWFLLPIVQTVFLSIKLNGLFIPNLCYVF